MEVFKCDAISNHKNSVKESEKKYTHIMINSVTKIYNVDQLIQNKIVYTTIDSIHSFYVNLSYLSLCLSSIFVNDKKL